MLAYKLEHTDEFEALEAAVRETPRGRAFLDEFARRIRATETDRHRKANLDARSVRATARYTDPRE